MKYLNGLKNLILENDNIIQLIGLIVTVFIAFLTAYITAKNEKKKSTTSFFKQEGISQQKKILDFWCSILMNDYASTVKEYKVIYKLNEKEKDTELFKLIMKDSFIYSSKITTRAIADYMQLIFKNKNQAFTGLVLVARIACMIKKDFSGEKTAPIDFLRLKLNDLDFIKTIKVELIILYYNFRNLLKVSIIVALLFIIYKIVF